MIDGELMTIVKPFTIFRTVVVRKRLKMDMVSTGCKHKQTLISNLGRKDQDFVENWHVSQDLIPLYFTSCKASKIPDHLSPKIASHEQKNLKAESRGLDPDSYLARDSMTI